MDSAAEEAKKDLINVSKDAKIEVAEWWKKWYMTAGHKRLGRILIAFLRNQKNSNKK